MTNKNLICSAESREDLQKMINEYFYSSNYVITDDGKIYNTKKETFLDGVKAVLYRNRWRFERV